MRALVLDFDGVIADSARESFAVALRTYAMLRPQSRLGTADGPALYGRFLESMPLGNRAEDYGTTLAAIDDGVGLADQAAYSRYRAAQDPRWLAEYHLRFYEVRRAWAHSDPAGWRAMLPPYALFLELLRRRGGQVPYAIATAKDRASVDALLAAYGIAEWFAPELVLDKEVGTRKTAHLTLVRERLDCAFGELTFVDDKVNHLDAVAPLGVRCLLAGWGYNGPRERALAAERGYGVGTLGDVEHWLFGPGLAISE